ncbi:hypothetical protein AUEXF2481DRAFT_42503 [Aureobasidium subglaciale EXF-2481]|uniref:Major facilitator superfamily (MFS) profile domain-containing protein n=1 Tax=Aureobasidium subglaciale (strain EXF-2481) TaxID=1043005 RepID=A0A074YA07_AURSE|nr:uncharacterized protein AUEXF2481DRAFT_42503 [Aureobasidium subglaciale EXF-2481]KEQ92819.1 hypothetical protein AUEXF2481DRAFT_42503 [Aureobasidium subglaciale EXF-2481]
MNDITFISISLPQGVAIQSTSADTPAPSPSSRQPTDLELLSPTSNHDRTLAPTDGGLAAYKLLAAAFVFETLLWGFPLSFGVFQEYYSKTPEFAKSGYISVVGTVASGLGYLGAPVSMLCLQRFGRWRREMIWVGWPICILGLVAGSFASSLEALILSQGVAYGLGFLVFYYPILSMVDEYWVAKRGMAYGILCAASGFSGAFMPFLLQTLLQQYGFRTTLRAVAVALIVLTGPLIPFLKGRLPVSRNATTRKIDWMFLRLPAFWIFSSANLLQGFGYFFPGLYLPSFASSLQLSPKTGPMLLALMSISQVLGQFTFGFLSDRNNISTTFLAAVSISIAGASTLGLWYTSTHLPTLVIFSLLYGFFAAGFTALWARMTSSMTSDPAASPMVFGLLNFQKGVGNVLAGPTGGLLVAGQQEVSEPQRYRPVILFTGVCLLASFGVMCLGWLKRLTVMLEERPQASAGDHVASSLLTG